MKVSLEYFASLKDQAEKSGEEYESESQTVLQLYEELRQKYHFSLAGDYIRFAVNDEYVTKDHNLRERDKVVFIPPVAGG